MRLKYMQAKCSPLTQSTLLQIKLVSHRQILVFFNELIHLFLC